MDREKEKIKLEVPNEEISEAEIMDFWEEGSEYIMYDGWDRIKEWFKRFFGRKKD